MSEKYDEDIKSFFAFLLDSGIVQGYLDGPRKNVLVCKTMNDWAISGSELAKRGFSCTSPGGYGGSSPKDRQNTYNKIWRSGTVCASVIEKRIFIFIQPQTEFDFCDVVTNPR